MGTHDLTVSSVASLRVLHITTRSKAGVSLHYFGSGNAEQRLVADESNTCVHTAGSGMLEHNMRTRLR